MAEIGTRQLGLFHIPLERGQLLSQRRVLNEQVRETARQVCNAATS
jgi:hypothetical protein